MQIKMGCFASPKHRSLHTLAFPAGHFLHNIQHHVFAYVLAIVIALNPPSTRGQRRRHCAVTRMLMSLVVIKCPLPLQMYL